MNPLLQLKATTPLFFITLALACIQFSPWARAVVPAPDGGYPGGNTAEGQNALLSLNVNVGTNNTAVGWFSLRSNVEGQLNTAVGAGTLFNNTVHRNTAIGGAAMFSNTVGSFNTAVGALSLLANSTGSSNTAIGDGALLNNTTGSFNTAIGRVALLSNTTGSGNVATGAQALVTNTTGHQNTAYGYQAMLDNTTGEGNTAVGYGALGSNTEAADNTAVGAQALASNRGTINTAIGFGALRQNNFGSGNVANGAFALANNTSGSNNIALGDNTGSGVTTASAVNCIGAELECANVSFTTWITNVYTVTPQSGTTAPVVVSDTGQLGTLASSERFKEDIVTMGNVSDAILALRPVTFHYKNDTKDTPQFGLIAEEVARINPALVLSDKEGKPYTVRYDAVNAMLLNEFLQEHRRNEEQQAKITRLQHQIEALTAGLQKVSAQLELSKPAPQTVLNDQ